MSINLNDWVDIKNQLTELQAKERSMRTLLAESLLGDKQEGSLTGLIDGVKCTAKAVMNYTVDRAELDMIWDSLTEEEKACIVFKPSVKPGAYNKLKNPTLARAITKKSGLPQLEVKD